MDKNLAPNNRKLDWIQKLEQGKFREMKDLKIDVLEADNKQIAVRLSDRIKDLNLGDDYIIHLRRKF